MVRVHQDYIQGVQRISGSRRTTTQGEGERLKIATYNVRTLLKDEHMQELEEELKENNMKWDVIGPREVRRKEESFTTLQSGHLLYHSEANNGQAGVGFLINKKWKDNITSVSSGNSRVAELVLRITDRYQLKINQSINQLFYLQTQLYHNRHIEIHRICFKQPCSKYRNSMNMRITHTHTIDVSSASGDWKTE